MAEKPRDETELPDTKPGTTKEEDFGRAQNTVTGRRLFVYPVQSVALGRNPANQSRDAAV
jgi:hypothetical protein